MISCVIELVIRNNLVLKYILRTGFTLKAFTVFIPFWGQFLAGWAERPQHRLVFVRELCGSNLWACEDSRLVMNYIVKFSGK